MARTKHKNKNKFFKLVGQYTTQEAIIPEEGYEPPKKFFIQGKSENFKTGNRGRTCYQVHNLR